MTDTQTKPKPAPSDAQRRVRLERSMQATARKVDEHRGKAKDLQKDLDEQVLEARKLGVHYRSIAELTGRSVAWVQASLARSGYVSPRKLKAAAAASA